jgi:hypothetical protein
MIARSSVLAAVALAGIAVTAFFVGRHVEEGRKTSTTTVVPPAPAPTSQPERLSYQALHASDVMAYSFADFYEALRSAPTETRKHWASEVEQMPAGPRRVAAVMGFYKLLIQFDPAVAIKSIREINDKRVQNLALEAAVDGVPGFAMADLATVMAELYKEPTGHTRSYSDELIEQWTDLDPAAVVRFLEQHRRADEVHPVFTSVIENWAQLDLKAAKEWMDSRDEWKSPEYQRAFINGWYENDRPAAVAYILAHASEKDMRDSVGNILRGLYYDAKDEARKFIEALPDDRIRRTAFRAAFENIMYDEVEDSGDAAYSPRAVAEWMVEFPTAYWKGRLKEVFKWSRKPPGEMISWIEKQSPAIQDLAAADYTPPWKASADDVLKAVFEVPDLRLRDQLLEGVFKRSYDIPLEDLREAIAKAPLSAEQRAHALQLMDDVESRPAEKSDDEEINDQGSEK